MVNCQYSHSPSPPAPLSGGEGRKTPSPPAPLPGGEGRKTPSPPALLPGGGENSSLRDHVRRQNSRGIFRRARRWTTPLLVQVHAFRKTLRAHAASNR